MRTRHLLVLAAAALLVAFGPAERTTPTQWALVIGISDYIHFGDEIGGNLPGAAADARAVADVLVNRYGFEPDNVKLILDHAATRDRLVAELGGWLPSVVRPGDHVTIYFAGHGSQTWNLDGTEEDGLDETICPADVMRGNAERDIRDKEMAVFLDRINTDNIVVIWDKCHARGSTRAVTPYARPRNLARNVAADVERPDPELEAELAAAVADLYAGGMPEQRHILEIAAAESHEVALDIAWPHRTGGDGHSWGGAFTTPFVQNLWNAPAGATYGQVFRSTVEDMRRNRFQQQPGIDDKPLRDRPLFWIDRGRAAPPPAGAAPAPGTVRVLEVTADGRAVLPGGHNADRTAGSIYGVGDGVLEVVDVGADRSTARVVGGGAAALRAGAEARLLAYRYPEAALRVHVSRVPAPLARGLAAELDGVPALRLLPDESAFAHLMIEERNGHWVVFNVEGFPRDSVAVATRPADAAHGLAAILRREYGQLQLSELENPANPFGLTFELGDRRSELRLGDDVSFRVRSERDGYLTVVDLTADGKVVVIFPNELATDNRIRGGGDMVIPTAAMDLSFVAQPPAGRGIVRAFVTERPMPIPFQTTDGFGLGEATEAAQIWTALRTAAGRPPVRDSDAIPVGNWATAAIVYDIRPR